ncbi:hypothetical protein, partial [Bacillus altitudinis]|uniref:hypothetical protein n=1 Tax=Bacillus altitudinis TaxID=293387 RepID=UPI0011A868F0
MSEKELKRWLRFVVERVVKEFEGFGGWCDEYRDGCEMLLIGFNMRECERFEGDIGFLMNVEKRRVWLIWFKRWWGNERVVFWIGLKKKWWFVCWRMGENEFVFVCTGCDIKCCSSFRDTCRFFQGRERA